MEKIHLSQGLRSFIIRLGLYIAIGLGISLFTLFYFNNTDFAKTYLTVPSQFIIEAPNIRTNIINALLFGIIATIIISYKKILNIKEFPFEKGQIVFMALTVISIILKYYFSYLLGRYTDFFMQAPILWGIVKTSFIILFAIFLSLSIFSMKFIRYFYAEFKKEIMMFLALTAGFFILLLIVQSLWTLFSGTISYILFKIFSIFFTDVTYQPHVISFTMAEGGGPLLGIGSFRAIVGKPCSGIDSFLLFTSLYSLIFILDYKRLDRKKAIIFFFIGAIGMFITNLIRIFLLFIIGAFVSASFAVGMFHTNIGWILFIIYFFVFWLLVSKAIYRKKENDDTREDDNSTSDEQKGRDKKGPGKDIIEQPRERSGLEDIAQDRGYEEKFSENT